VRSNQGWYEMGLPWKSNHPFLPSNENGSLRRLNNLTRKLKQTELTEPYAEIIKTQREEGIIEDAKEPPAGTEFYIPHKPVVREAAESTKLRIVYDASALDCVSVDCAGLCERHNQKNGTKKLKLSKGDVVIIKSDERNRANWSLGIVDELYVGCDGVIPCLNHTSVSKKKKKARVLSCLINLTWL
jgi:hypothetical protein